MTAINAVISAIVEAVSDEVPVGELVDMACRSTAVAHAEARRAGAAALAAGTPSARAQSEMVAARRGRQARKGGGAVPDGLCAPHAWSEALAMAGVKPKPTALQVQKEVTGSTSPSSWGVREFIAAARLFDVVVLICRGGRAEAFGAGPWAQMERKPKVMLDLTVDGSHVEYADMVWGALAQSARYIDVGASGDSWKGRVTILGHAAARSAVEAMRCGCCGRAASFARSCVPPSAWRQGMTGHRCLRPGACAAQAIVAGIAGQASLRSPPAGAFGHVACSAGPPRPPRPGVQCSPVFCSAIHSLADRRALREGWHTVGRSRGGAPPGYDQLRGTRPDLRLPEWADVLGPLDETVPEGADLFPLRHYTDRQQEEWLGMDAAGDLPERLAPLQRWAEHWAAAEAGQRRPAVTEAGQHVPEVVGVERRQPAAGESRARGGRGGITREALAEPISATPVVPGVYPATGRAAPKGPSAGRRTPRAWESREHGRHVSRRSGGPNEAGDESGEAGREHGRQCEEGQPPAAPAPARGVRRRGAALSNAPAGADDVHALLAASGRAVPHHVDGHMRTMGFHLHRILAVQPGDDPRLHNDAEYYRYALAMQSPLAEYIVLDARARRENLKWAQQLGRRLPAVRELLPPTDRVAFARWDSGPLLRELREADEARQSSRRQPCERRTEESMCSLAQRGRIAAARARIRGEEPRQRPAADECLRDELQRKFPEPGAQGALEEASFDEIAAEIERLRTGIPEGERISADDLLEAARRQRGPAAPGPDGWSGAFLRRLATLYPRETAEILRRDYVALACGADPLRVAAVTEATVGGLAKPAGGNRPIVISRVTSRCILSYVTTSARDRLRTEMEKGRQYGLTGVAQALLPPLVMAAKCARARVPFAFTDDDFENAFNAVEQGAQASAIRRLARVAPEFAACALRDQCVARGDVDMVLRGPREAGAANLYVYKRARGCPQGSPASPPTFGSIMCELEREAETAMAGLHANVDASTAMDLLWGAMREVEGSLAATPPAAWEAAARRILEQPRPGAWGGQRGEASSAYLDDAHSGGWVVACVAKSLHRLAAARRMGLLPNRAKCKVMTAERHREDVDAIISPLRAGDPALWPVVTQMRVLGVEVVDPADPDLVQAAVQQGLEHRVVEPCRMLTAELAAGAERSTAYWLLMRYVIPNATFYAHIWGLLSPAAAWSAADVALDEVCEALAPADLKGRVLAGSRSLRHELSLPQRDGGLGIPVLAAASAHMAASQAPFKEYRDAQEAGMLSERAELAFAQSEGPLARLGERTPVGVDKYHEAMAAAIARSQPAEHRRAWNRRREQNTMRAGMWAFNSTPWERARSLKTHEWDILWRLAFGGMDEETRARIDAPRHGHTFRGRSVEHAIREAIEDVLPAGVARLWSQPSPEYHPPDHAARCAAAGTSVDGWKRADLTAAFVNSESVTLDVRTVHLQCASQLQTPVATQLRALENEKTAKYSAYYSRFRPYVVSITGAVSETAFGAIKEIARQASNVTRPRLHWEKYRWAVDIVQRVALATVKAAAWDATHDMDGRRGMRRSGVPWARAAAAC